MNNKLKLISYTKTEKVYSGYGYNVIITSESRHDFDKTITVKISELEYFKPSISVSPNFEVFVETSARLHKSNYVAYMEMLSMAFACANEIEARLDEFLSFDKIR